MAEKPKMGQFTSERGLRILEGLNELFRPTPEWLFIQQREDGTLEVSTHHPRLLKEGLPKRDQDTMHINVQHAEHENCWYNSLVEIS